MKINFIPHGNTDGSIPVQQEVPCCKVDWSESDVFLVGKPHPGASPCTDLFPNLVKVEKVQI